MLSGKEERERGLAPQQQQHQSGGGGGDKPKFCPECGAANAGGKFCGECGFKW
jgi:membrane protease subunit (stomatin/prohibitin family)